MNYARPDPWGPGASNRPGLPDQVGVFLVGVTPAGLALLDHQLFLPESWCEPTRAAKDRRDQAHIPEDVTFRTKPRIAAELVRNAAVFGQVELDWVVADSE